MWQEKEMKLKNKCEYVWRCRLNRITRENQKASREQVRRVETQWKCCYILTVSHIHGVKL